MSSSYSSDSVILRSNKRAFLVGLNYPDTSHELRGCVNDAHNIRRLLLDHCGFLEGDITLLTDEDPTSRRALRRKLKQFIREVRKEDVDEVWITYSGHGSYQRDYSGSESDGNDEGWVCSDEKLLTDDELHYLLSRIPRGVKVTCFFDMCHSGSSLDMDWRYRLRTIRRSGSVRTNRDDHLRAKVTLMSGSRDDQTSADAHLAGKYQGAMTRAMLNVLETHDYVITYHELLKGIRRWLKDHDFKQKPQLTSSWRINKRTRIM